MSSQDELMPVLEQGLKPFGFSEFAEPLLRYLRLMEKWNKAYNLTAIRHISDMIPLHLYDSLAIHPWLRGSRLLDVGSGAGLPGIPLAITHPHLEFVLLDSNGKKTRFLQEVKRQLALKNVNVIQSRVESYHPGQGFDTVISRAFSSLEQMTQWTHHLIGGNGIWLAMKGRYPENELEPLHYHCVVKTYSVEGIEGERCCVLIDNATEESSWQKS